MHALFINDFSLTKKDLEDWSGWAVKQIYKGVSKGKKLPGSLRMYYMDNIRRNHEELNVDKALSINKELTLKPSVTATIHNAVDCGYSILYSKNFV